VSPDDEESARRVSERLKRLGFEAGESVHEFIPDFSIDTLKESLFESTYSHPKALNIRPNDEAAAVLPVVLTAVRQIYLPYLNRRDDHPLGCYEYPEWQADGWLLKSGFDPYGEVVTVRLYIQTTDDGSLATGYIQRVPATPDPDGLVSMA
jgi:hypothetical protein